MKLVRYGVPRQEKPGILDSDGHIRDLAGIVPDITAAALSPTLASLNDFGLAKLPVVQGNQRLGPCVGGVGKFICIGLNYSDHAAEAGMKIPSEPAIFMKATSAGVIRSHWTIEPGRSSQYLLLIRERPRVVSGLQCRASLYPRQLLERDIPFR